jgi:hypothetical protein
MNTHSKMQSVKVKDKLPNIIGCRLKSDKKFLL